jgi:ribosomal protein S18 acetylase RimI-like enzyme
VRKSNTGAIRLYAERGYRYVTVWARYYSGGEDALVMEKTLGAGPTS